MLVPTTYTSCKRADAVAHSELGLTQFGRRIGVHVRSRKGRKSSIGHWRCNKWHRLGSGGHLEADLVADGGRIAEPAGGAGEVAVPALVDHAAGGRPGALLPQAVEAIRRLRVQAHTVVVPEQALHLHADNHATISGPSFLPGTTRLAVMNIGNCPKEGPHIWCCTMYSSLHLQLVCRQSLPLGRKCVHNKFRATHGNKPITQPQLPPQKVRLVPC